MASVNQVIAAYIEGTKQLKQAIADEFLSRVERYTPVDSGALKAGWEVTVEGTAIRAKNDTPYADYVERGIPMPNSGTTGSGQTGFPIPRAMLARTIAELDDIVDVAAAKVMPK